MGEGPALCFQWCHLLPAPLSPPPNSPPGVLRGVTLNQSCHQPHGDQCGHGWDLRGDASVAPQRYRSALKHPDTSQVPPTLGSGTLGEAEVDADCLSQVG